MALTNVDLNLLPALDALLGERHVTRAAERLSIGQSAMSSALGRLRRHFGDPLLVRAGCEYRLSALAESLVDPVRELLAAADDILGKHNSFEPATAERTFTIMTSDYATMLLLKPLLAEMTAEAPGIRFRVTAFADDFEERLRRAGVDLLICPMQLSGALNDLPRAVLFEDQYVLVGDRDNPDLKSPVDIEEFRSLRYVGNPLLVDAQLAAHGIRRTAELAVQAHVSIGTRSSELCIFPTVSHQPAV